MYRIEVRTICIVWMGRWQCGHGRCVHCRLRSVQVSNGKCERGSSKEGMIHLHLTQPYVWRLWIGMNAYPYASEAQWLFRLPVQVNIGHSLLGVEPDALLTFACCSSTVCPVRQRTMHII